MNWIIKEKISQNSFSTIYKVEHKKTREIAAFKIIHSALYNDSIRRRLKQSFISTSKISHNNCVKMYEWIETKDKIGFIMEFVDTKPISDFLQKNKNLSVDRIINLIIQISKGLSELHKHNLIHRDLKPSNILFSKDNIIKITDFDFVKVEDSLNMTLDGTFLGTAKYASPEQHINASKIDIRSDLYSLGVIFYELITGKLPFTGESYSEIALKHLKSQLISPKELVSDIPISINKIIVKLLEKIPKDRYGSVFELTRDLKRITGKETSNIQINYHSYPDFIGRKSSLITLEKAYKKVIKSKGKTVLIDGESGIGKTRLWEEFKLELELKQIPVIDIRCEEESGIYKPLKTVIKRIIEKLQFLSDEKKITILGKLAWDLVKIAPEIEDLDILNKIEKIPVLKGKGSELRLFEAITNFIKNFLTFSENKELKHKGLIIYFDDLHLVEEPIYRWLSYATRNLINIPILLIASFRTEFIKSNLKNTIENLKKDKLIDIIELKPFIKKEITMMLNSITHLKSDKEFINELFKLTRGNPLFIDEIIHNLNENKGKYVLTLNMLKELKTIKKIISNRINLLHNNTKEILQAAAISGKTFNIDILTQIFDYNETQIMNYLEECRIMNLVEYQKNNYSFHHDSIRETLLEELEINKRKKYNGIIAKKIESEYLKKKTNEKIEELANRYFSAGISRKAIKYCSLAGDLAKEKFANEKAISYYEKVLKILKNKNPLKEIEILIKQADVYNFVGKWDKAERIYRECIYKSEKTGNKSFIIKSHNSLGWQLYSKGNNNEALQLLEKSHRLSKTIGDKKGLSKAVLSMGAIYLVQGDYTKAMKFFKKLLLISKELGDKDGISRAFGNIGLVYKVKSNYKKAMEYYKKDLKIGEELGNKREISTVIGNIGLVHYHQGNYTKAMECYEKQLTISKELGDKKGKSRALGTMGLVYYNQGNYLKAIKCYEKYLAISKELGNKAGISRAIGYLGILYKTQGNFKKAIECYKKQLVICEELGDKAGSSGAIGNMSIIYKDQCNYYKAKEYCMKSLKIFEKLGDKKRISMAFENLGNIFKDQCNYDKAKEYFDKAININKEFNHKPYLFSLLLNKAEICFKTKKLKEAKKTNNELLELLKEIKDKKYLFKSRLLAIKIDNALGQHEKSLLELDKMLKDAKDDIEKAEIHYGFWVIGEYNDDYKKDRRRYKHAKNALKLYEKIPVNKRDIVCKNRIDELSKVIENISQKVTMKEKHSIELVKTLSKFLNPETAYNEFLQFLLNNINADCALILTMTEETNKTNPIIQKDDKFEVKAFSQNLNKKEIDFSQSILRSVLKQNKPLIIANALERADLKDNSSIMGKVFLSVIAVPLKDSKENIIGALYLDRREVIKEPFVEEDIKEVQKIAEILAPILAEQEKVMKAKLLSDVEHLGLFIGKSKTMKRLYKTIEKVAKVDKTTLIHGETGTGKELAAKALRKLSKRNKFPFIVINCSAIPGELAETELFGHEKGSFSGADEAKKGKFELAENGILFLDEIAELPLKMQAKLLRVLQNKEIWKVGGQSSITVDVRVIASTHKDLHKEVEAGNFREDLYYRLNILKIDIPSLRERKEDILLLAYHFLENFSDEKKIDSFTQDAINKLLTYRWSGNVRELENKIAKAIVIHEGNNSITAEDLFPRCENINEFPLKDNSLQKQIDYYEKYIIDKILRKCNWNMSKTAKILQINRARLYRKIEKFNFKSS